MFEKLRKLSIQGGYFEENEDFDLLPENVNSKRPNLGPGLIWLR